MTVVIPTYRRPAMLAEALESVLAQSYAEFDVIVANDDPEDDLAATRARLSDPRITWMTRPVRLGVLENHFDALRQARGEFLAILDDDDRWAPALLSTLVPILEDHPDVAVAFAGHHVVDQSGRIDQARSDYSRHLYGRDALSEGPHPSFMKLAVVDKSMPLMCAAVFRASAVDLRHYDARAGSHWDIWLAYLLASSGGAAWYVPERLAYYRAHYQSQTATGGVANPRSELYIWGQFLADPAVAPWKAEMRRRIGETHRHIATYSLRAGDATESRRNARLALTESPGARALAVALTAYLAPRLGKRILEHRARKRIERRYSPAG